jgi:hypothetical protein
MNRGVATVGHSAALDYGPTLSRLLAAARLNEVGPGDPQDEARAALEELTPASVVAPHPLADRDMASACCAALWLRFDFLDRSHHISQAIDTPEGSFWHGVMHRREPDFFNAKYWFRRVGRHELFGPLAEEARSLAAEELTTAKTSDSQLGRASAMLKESGYSGDVRFLKEQDVWDPVRFVDLCELALDASPPLHTFCRRLQQLEWQLMFDHCYRHAVG